MEISYLANNTDMETCVTACPYQLEYSEKDDKFRLWAVHRSIFWQINLSTIMYCEIKDFFTPSECSVKPETHSLKLSLCDRRNALERVMLHFSDLEKKTERIDDDHFRVELRYCDSAEMVIRLLSFGPAVKVLAPQEIVDEIQKRIERQKKLFEA